MFTSALICVFSMTTFVIIFDLLNTISTDLHRQPWYSSHIYEKIGYFV